MFLPPPEIIPSLTLLVAHFIPVRHIPGSRVSERIRFSLGPLITQCKRRVQDMVNIAEWEKNPEKCQWSQWPDDLAQAMGPDTDSQSIASVSSQTT